MAVWSGLEKYEPSNKGMKVIPETSLLPPTHNLRFIDDAINIPAKATLKHATRAGLIFGNVTRNQRLTSESHFQDIRNIRIESESPIKFSAGDALQITPRNSTENVEIAIAAFGWSEIADKPIMISRSSIPSGDDDEYGDIFESLTTIRNILFILEFTMKPTRYTFQLLSHLITSGEDYRSKLEFLGSREGASDRTAYILAANRSVIDVWNDFKSESDIFPINYLFDISRRMRPRLYSISNSEHEDAVEITVAVIDNVKLVKRKPKGVCSIYLAGIEVGANVLFSVCKGGLKAAASDVPIVCVGAGTGVAPLRSLILSRGNLSTDLLVFGCRFQLHDYIYGPESELGNWKCSVVNTFSRDSLVGYGPYVSDAIEQNCGDVCDIVRRNAAVYVCGRNGLRSSVKQAFISLFAKFNLGSSEEGDPLEFAEREYEGRVESGQIQFETW